MASPRNRLFAKGSAPTGDGSWSFRTDENSLSPAPCWTTRRIRRSRCLAGVGRLGRTTRLFREVRQICRGQGDPLLHDFRRRQVRFLKRLPSFRRWAAQRKSMVGLKTPSPPGCRPVDKSIPSGFSSNSTRTRILSEFELAPRSTSTSRRPSIWAKPPWDSPPLSHPRAAPKNHEISLFALSFCHFLPDAPRKRRSDPCAESVPCYGDCSGRRPESSHAGNREGIPGGPIHRPEFSGPNARATHRLPPRTRGRVELPAIQTLCAATWSNHCGIESLFVLLHKTNSEQINAQQKAYAGSARAERCAERRIDELQQKDSPFRIFKAKSNG